MVRFSLYQMVRWKFINVYLYISWHRWRGMWNILISRCRIWIWNRVLIAIKNFKCSYDWIRSRWIKYETSSNFKYNFFHIFYRRYGTKCAGCSQGISPNDLVRRARNKVFHLKCFTCMICRKQLSTGEELYIMDENRFICKDDYISSKLQGKKFTNSSYYEPALFDTAWIRATYKYPKFRNKKKSNNFNLDPIYVWFLLKKKIYIYT